MKFASHSFDALGEIAGDPVNRSGVHPVDVAEPTGTEELAGIAGGCAKVGATGSVVEEVSKECGTFTREREGKGRRECRGLR